MKVLATIIIIAATVAVGYVGSLFTTQGIQTWYPTLTLPSWTPDGSVIGIVWTTIYILTALSAIITWHKMGYSPQRKIIFGLFVFNGILNVAWSYIFFVQHEIGMAVAEMLVLNITTILLAFMIWPFHKLASLLLVPYIAWVSFATYLAYTVLKLNS